MYQQKEQWRPVVRPGYENYEVSTRGRIRNGKTGRVLQVRRHRGRNIIRLASRGRSKTLQLSRLIAETFHGPIPPGYDVDHMGPKHVDAPHRLRLLPAAVNRAQKKRRGARHGRAKLNAALVHRLRRLRRAGRTYRELAALAGVSLGAVRCACLGQTWSHLKGPVAETCTDRNRRRHLAA